MHLAYRIFDPEKESSYMFPPYTEVTTKTTSVKDIYGIDSPPIPQGFKAVGFRSIKQAELFLGVNGFVNYVNCPTPAARIILEKVPTRRLVFESTGEVRKVNTGEFYIAEKILGHNFADHGSVIKAAYPTIYDWPIMRLVSDTAV